MKTLRELIEDLQGLISFPTIGITTTCADLASFDLLQNLVAASMRAVGTARHISSDQLRTWNTFMIGVERCSSMSPMAARGHLGAIWRAGANEVCRQLPEDVSHAIEAAVTTFLGEGPHG